MDSFNELFSNFKAVFLSSRETIFQIVPIFMQVIGIIGIISTIYFMARDFKWYSKLSLRISSLVKYALIFGIGYLIEVLVEEYSGILE